MKFEVPQFIDIEDKVFGPLTFKQFIYLAGSAGLSVVIWVFLPLLLAIPLIGVVVGLGVALAFYKVNNEPFIALIESALRYSLGHKLYIWKKMPKKVTKEKEDGTQESGMLVPRIADSKLRDLAWSLDVHDSLNGGGESPL
ncbi:MAG: PrgI family protein [Candidatus Campbellbacteria bacterium]|nr:PrgI family protein [Candidatus Campbellbacteria bacterium]